MTPAAKLIAACDGCPATAQGIVLDEILALLEPFGDSALLMQAEANIRLKMAADGVESNTLDAVTYLMEIRKQTRRHLQGVVFS